MIITKKKNFDLRADRNIIESKGNNRKSDYIVILFYLICISFLKKNDDWMRKYCLAEANYIKSCSFFKKNNK